MTMNDQTSIAASRSGMYYETDTCILDIYTQTLRAYYVMAGRHQRSKQVDKNLYWKALDPAHILFYVHRLCMN